MWEARVEQDMVSVGQRQHSYLFWEFENNNTTSSSSDDKDKEDKAAADEVSRLVGLESLVQHADSAYLVDAARFGEWCHEVLGVLMGLGVRHGSTITVTAEGPDEAEAAAQMLILLQELL